MKYNEDYLKPKPIKLNAGLKVDLLKASEVDLLIVELAKERNKFIEEMNRQADNVLRNILIDVGIPSTLSNRQMIEYINNNGYELIKKEDKFRDKKYLDIFLNNELIARYEERSFWGKDKITICYVPVKEGE